MSRYLVGLAIAAASISVAQARNSNANDQFGAPIRASIAVTSTQNSNNTTALAAPTQRQDVFLMNVRLSDSQKQKLRTFHPTQADGFASTSMTASLPTRVELGMNNLPVFNQGWHGSCVTFANTAAIDAVLNKGEYMSPLCTLTLGTYIEQHGYTPSGWNGTYGSWLLSRIREFGIVSMANQRANGCGGLTEYPTRDSDEGKPMSVDDYYQVSENLNDTVYWYSLITLEQRFNWDASDVDAPDRLLFNVKKALASRNAKRAVRVTFGSLLPVDYCSAGACGKYHKTNDTWAITKAIMKDQDPNFGGHEMVFTGYDDNAIAVDNEGGRHKGLLFIRNSWGPNAGDNGDFYMTYDFFKQYVMEAQVIVNGVEQ